MTIIRASDGTVSAALACALGSAGIRGELGAVSRRENVYESTHRSEVIDCQIDGAVVPPLLCKYGPAEDTDHLGLRHGLAYEAEVYRHVLAGLPGPARFFGSYTDPEHGLTWLFLEYLDEGWQLDLGPETAIVDAAAMMGELHRAAAGCALGDGLRLNRYTEGYFRRCLAHADRQTAAWRHRVPGYKHLVERFEAALPSLMSAPQTVVHGEFTPHNVVWAHARPRVVDWEQAAVGVGEIDLAALTDDWDEDLAAGAARAYTEHRWPNGPEHDFSATLAAARLYWLFRWLSDPAQAGTEEEIAWLAERANELSPR